MSEQQSKPEQSFPFKFWAVLIGLQSLTSLVMLLFPVPNAPPLPPFQIAIQWILLPIAMAAAVGFWLERKWGLWLYVAMLAFFYVQGIALLVNERVTTGAISFPGMRIGTLVIGTLFFVMFYNQRHQFK